MCVIVIFRKCRFNYVNAIGLGLYDIHSSNIPVIDTMYQRCQQLLQYSHADQLWLNTNSGLKTREWPEKTAALSNLCKLVQRLRAELHKNNHTVEHY